MGWDGIGWDGGEKERRGGGEEGSSTSDMQLRLHKWVIILVSFPVIQLTGNANKH